MPNKLHHSSLTEELDAQEASQKAGLLHRWNALTALPEPLVGASFEVRETVRRSRLTSNVLFFFTVMVVALLPACYFSPYPIYFWLTLGLAGACVIGLVLNRQGYTNVAGAFVTLAGFTALTVALFSTIPFDETTLQGYDMYIIVELLAVSLLPARSVFIFLGLGITSILVTFFTMKHSPALDLDLQTRLLLILARPIGTLFLGAGVAYILASHLTAAIRRVGRVEEIARLEHELAKRSDALQNDIQQILATHIAVANGDHNARAPLAENAMLWQIAQSLNTLLVRHQRALQAEQQLKEIDRVVDNYVVIIQQAKQQRLVPLLYPGRTQIDPLIAELQGVTVGLLPINLPTAPLRPSIAYRLRQRQSEGQHPSQ